MIFTHFFNSSLLAGHCLFCLEKSRADSSLCQACSASLERNTVCCGHCALPLEQTGSSTRLLCGQCLSHETYYDRVYSPYLYSEAIRYLIKKMKYQKKIHFARTLSRLFIEQTQHETEFPLPQVIIPMPMHSKRLRQRGFNQALELCRFFASHYQLPLNYTSLVRSRYTQLQAGLNARQRQKNVHRAFELNTALQYEHIVLVDDVMTTGSTVNEAAKILKQNGVRQVDVWIIARAGLHS